MEYMQFTGKTIEDAKNAALKALEVSSVQELDIIITDEGKKGILGIGSKDAVIEAKKKDNYEDMLRNLTKDILNSVNVKADIMISYLDENVIKLSLTGQESSMFIGRRGSGMYALQQIIAIAMYKNTKERRKIVLDIENYREIREKSLQNFAEKLAAKVISTGRSIRMEPMKPYERRIVHACLSSNEQVDTRSEGAEPQRRVVISPKAKN